MAKKTADLTLEELYDKPKITPTVEKVIIAKEDFSHINPTYCSKVCTFASKCTTGISLVSKDIGEVDVLVIQDDHPSPDKYKTSERIEKIHHGILKFIFDSIDKDIKWEFLTTLKCRPTEIDQKLKNADVRKCSPYLLHEINQIKPKVILCLGTFSSKVLGCNKSVFSNRGEIVNSPYGVVVHSLHPKSLIMLRQNSSGAMWGPDYYSCLHLDVKKCIDIARGTVQIDFDLHGRIQWYMDHRVTICKSIEDVRQVVRTIEGQPVTSIISFDTETTGLDPFDKDAKLLCIQFGWKVNKDVFAGVIPLWHRDNNTIDPAAAWELVKPILENPKIPKVAHNGKFDIKYIYCTTGVRVQGAVFDTMLLLHEMNSGIQGNYGLKKAAWDYLYHLGIAGYEDLLPELTKIKDEDEITEEESNEQPEE